MIGDRPTDRQTDDTQRTMHSHIHVLLWQNILGYHFIFRESQKEKASLDDVKDSIRETLGTKKLDSDNTMSVTALTELRKKYGVDIIDSEIKKQYGNYISNTIASLEKQKSENK